MEEVRRKWLWLVVILLFAAAMRGLYLFFFQVDDPFFSQLIHDARRYHGWATALLHGESWESGPFYQAPLYPYLLSFLYFFFSPNPLVAYLFQALLGLAMIFLVYKVGARAYGERSGLLAAAFAALYGVFLFHETKLLPGSFVAFLSILIVERMQAAMTSTRAYSWMIAGLAVGIGVVASPSLLLLGPFGMVLLMLKDLRNWMGKTRCVLFFLLGIVLMVAPVTLRNVWTSGEIVLVSTNGGMTFYQGNNPASEGLFSAPKGFSGSIFKVRQESRMLAEKETGHAMEESEISRFWFQKGFAFIIENPTKHFWLLSRKASFAVDNYEHALEYSPWLDRNPIRYFVPLPFAFILGLAVLRLFKRGNFNAEEIPILMIILAQGATLLIFYVSSRYRLPLIPALSAMAGAGAITLYDRWRQALRKVILPGILAVFIVLISFFYMPARTPQLYDHQEAMAFCDWAWAHFKEGKTKESITLYQNAIELDPEYPYAHLDLSKVLSAIGDLEGAEREIRRTLILAPVLAEAHYDLGVLLYEKDDLDAAADAFAKAFRLDPKYSDAGNNLIGTCLQLSRFSQAIEAWETMKRQGLKVDASLESWMVKNTQRMEELNQVDPGKFH